MVLRADKQARAAVNQFDTWYTQKSSQFGDSYFHCDMANSQLSIARRAAPHSLLYFLIQVLQRLLHQFWATAQKDSYVQLCGRVNGRCPPSIIAVLFQRECKDYSPCMSVAIPRTKKQRLDDSESARAAARSSRPAGSQAEASSRDAAPLSAMRHDFWQTFAENVMQHLV